MKVLVTGANGKLGQEIQSIASHFYKLQFVFADFKMIDITEHSLVDVFVRNYKAEAVINCAAYMYKLIKLRALGVSNVATTLKKVH